MIWKFRSGAQWRGMPPEFGVWQTVYDCFVRRRDAGVLLALTDGMIADAAQWGQTNLSLVSVDSTVARTHHDAAGMRVEEEVLSSLEKAAEASKGAVADGSPPPLLTSQYNMRSLIVREDYELAKPHPEPYLAGLKRFGAATEETLGVEDSVLPPPHRGARRQDRARPPTAVTSVRQ